MAVDVPSHRELFEKWRGLQITLLKWEVYDCEHILPKRDAASSKQKLSEMQALTFESVKGMQ